MPPRKRCRPQASARGCALALRAANALDAAALTAASGEDGALRWLSASERCAAACWALALMEESIRPLHEATWGWDGRAKRAEIEHDDSRLVRGARGRWQRGDAKVWQARCFLVLS